MKQKNIFKLVTLLFLSHGLFAQTDMKPEDTEIWQPAPPKVTPGQNISEPPSDAIILFQGKNMDEWIVGGNTEWIVEDNFVTITPSIEKKISPTSIRTKKEFGDMQLHVEWRSPAEIDSSGQRRGNSGIIIQGRYEVQVLDSYDNPTYINGQAASVYKQHIPLVNASLPPGEWQTYDIFFTAPRFDVQGNLLKPAFVTVEHNGILVQYNAEIQGTIKHVGYPEYIAHPLKQPLYLQDHGNAVSFRNIWVREL